MGGGIRLDYDGDWRNLASITALKFRSVNSVAQTPAPPVRSRWIVSRWLDLALFVATPALILPLFWLAQTRWSGQDIYLFVAAFGAMGHHLPGMIRAYGDRGLFDRFRVRFVVAPLVLAVVCIYCSLHGVKAIEVVAFCWGIWHGLMQTYGFARIYDAKESAAAPMRARADFLLCLVGFASAVALSPNRLRTFLDLFYEAGGPLLSPALLAAVRTALLAALGLVLLVYLWQHFSDWRKGRGFGVVKHVLLATSLGFWWYCNNGIANILVGIALFEVFHDVQYLSIVWLYNGNRVAKDPGIGGFLRFVFRRSGSMMGVYVGLVFAYGAIAWYAGGVPQEWLKQSLLGLVTASALLHFYYDGFIWKVRESSTRQSLGLEGNALTEGALLRSWMVHGLRWAVLAVPFAALCAVQLSGRALTPLERRAAVAQALPSDSVALLNLGKALQESGDVAGAEASFSKSLATKPDAEAEFCLALIESDRQNFPAAAEHYRRSLALDPKSAEAHANLGALLLLQNKPREARTHLEASIQLRPRQAIARAQLGALLIDDGDYRGAAREFQAALKVQPEFAAAKDGLARASAFLR